MAPQEIFIRLSDEIDRLNTEIRRMISRVSELRSADQALRFMCEKRKWRNVGRVRLTPGVIYLVRQTILGEVKPLVVARWSNTGWNDILGNLISTTATRTTKLEVWK
jgi:hypothetical protein